MTAAEKLELLRDKERLDWLIQRTAEGDPHCIDSDDGERFRIGVVAAGVPTGDWHADARAAIDEARKDKT